MKIDTEKLIALISLAGYFVLAYFVIEFFSISKYDWMREPGDSVCSLPPDPDDTRDIIAPLFLFFLGTPLLIALIRDILFKDVFKAVLYGFGLTAVTVYWWWSFFGQYGACAA